jgi:hypothetical protein
MTWDPRVNPATSAVATHAAPPAPSYEHLSQTRLVRRYFAATKDFNLSQLLPSRGTLGACAAAAATAAASERALVGRGLGGGGAGGSTPAAAAGGGRDLLQALAMHVGVGCSVLAVLGAAVWRFERGTVGQLLELRRAGGEGGAPGDSGEGSTEQGGAAAAREKTS